MFWLPITIISYALNAAALATDKFLLNKKIPNPAVYTIIISFLGILALVLLPFDWSQPTGSQLAWELISGFLFGAGIYLMFVALNRGEASRIIPFLGGLQPLIVLPLAWLFVGEAVSEKFLLAFFVIIMGTVLISYGKGKADKVAYGAAIFSAILFAVSLIIAKYAYNSQGSFITPFVMTRLGALLFALCLFAWPRHRRSFFAVVRRPQKQTSGLLLFGQTSGALSSILVNFAIAISVGATAIINALQGLQYVFLLLIVIAVQRIQPGAMKEKMTRKILWQKIIATAFIVAGLAILAL
ncbi:MAG: EamA family transporter [Patescibacteria group bacterium]|jgi:drug/metabolite transporter (DMT)-like permease